MNPVHYNFQFYLFQSGEPKAKRPRGRPKGSTKAKGRDRPKKGDEPSASSDEKSGEEEQE